MDFVIRPQSKIDPEQIRARAKQAVQDQRRLKVFIPLKHLGFVSLYKLARVLSCLLTVEAGPTEALILFVGHADEQEIAAAESAQEEKPSGVEAQRGRPWHDQVPVDHPLWHPQSAVP